MKVVHQEGYNYNFHLPLQKFFTQLESCSCPELNRPKVFVRGDEGGEDNNIVPSVFYRQEEADQAAKEIINLCAKANDITDFTIDVRPIFANPYEVAINGTSESDGEVFAYILVPTVTSI
jgi:hypothetical protein